MGANRYPSISRTCSTRSWAARALLRLACSHFIIVDFSVLPSSFYFHFLVAFLDRLWCFRRLVWFVRVALRSLRRWWCMDLFFSLPVFEVIHLHRSSSPSSLGCSASKRLRDGRCRLLPPLRASDGVRSVSLVASPLLLQRMLPGGAGPALQVFLRVHLGGSALECSASQARGRASEVSMPSYYVQLLFDPPACLPCRSGARRICETNLTCLPCRSGTRRLCGRSTIQRPALSTQTPVLWIHPCTTSGPGRTLVRRS